MREYWFEAIGIIQYRYRSNIIKPYDGCTLDHPKPFFVDRTRDVDKFWNNIHSLDLKRMLVELDSEKTSLIPDVLCPWGCTKFCFEAGHTNLAPPAKGWTQLSHCTMVSKKGLVIWHGNESTHLCGLLVLLNTLSFPMNNLFFVPQPRMYLGIRGIFSF
jgi:hypothetical protein